MRRPLGDRKALRHAKKEAEMSSSPKVLLVLALLLLVPCSAGAQTPSESSSEQVLKPEQIDALVAPIALYPDTLLSQVLMA